MITVLRREMIRIVMLILLDVIVFFKKKKAAWSVLLLMTCRACNMIEKLVIKKLHWERDSALAMYVLPVFKLLW